MNEENQISYYSVTPATIRYDNRLKPAEKLIYGEITALTNMMGYCFASNRYFANLYDVTTHTASQWISHLEKLGYISIELIRNEKNQIKQRRIYIKDTPYVQKNTYPYVLKSTYPMYQNVQDNNINNNINNLFILIINKNNKIPNNFYNILERLDFIYPENILSTLKEDKIQMLKNIIFILYDIFNSEIAVLLSKVNRESLLNLYMLAQEQEPLNVLACYKKLIINKYTNNSI